MYTNGSGMAVPQSLKNGPAVWIKLLHARMTEDVLLQQLPDLTEGLLFHRYLPIIYRVEIRYRIACVVASAGTPW